MDNFQAQYSYITNEGNVFTFRSNLDAPRYCLINIDIQKPEPEHWTTLIPQHEQDVMGETNKEVLLDVSSQDLLSRLLVYLSEELFMHHKNMT